VTLLSLPFWIGSASALKNMPAQDPQTLISQSSCIVCGGMTIKQSLEITLLNQIAEGAVQFTSLATYSGTDKVSHVTASISPPANALILALVTASASSLPNTVPVSITGNGLTWVLISDQESGIGKQGLGCSMYRAMGASPSTGAVTVTMPTASNSVCVNIVSLSGVNTSGTNGSGAVVQSNRAAGSSTTPAVALAAISSPSNSVFAVVSRQGNPFNGTPKSGFTESMDSGAQGVGIPAMGGCGIYAIATTDNAPSVTISSSVWNMVAIEVKAA